MVRLRTNFRQSETGEAASSFAGQSVSGVPADKEMERVLRTPPIESLNIHDPFETHLARWKHQPFHDVVKPMSDHVVMTYLGAMQRLERVSGRDHRSAMGRRGTITVIPAGSSSRWDIHGPMDIVQLYMAPQLLDHIAQECPGSTRQLIEITAGPDAFLAALLERSLGSPDNPSFLEALYRQQITSLIAVHLLKGPDHAADYPGRASGGLAPHVLRTVLERLSSDDELDFSLGALAAEANLSRFHFCRAFKKSTGVSPHEWLRERRLEQAMGMLRDPRVLITDVAGQLGYATLTAFSVAFKRHTGLTPSEWRNAVL